MSRDRVTEDLAMIARNAIDYIVELERRQAEMLSILRAAVADWDEEVSRGRWLDAARAAIERAHGIGEQDSGITSC